MFQLATIMSALWIGANSMLFLEAYGVEPARKPRVETSFSFAQAHANAALDKQSIL
jgi:hypothetical protein